MERDVKDLAGLFPRATRDNYSNFQKRRNRNLATRSASDDGAGFVNHVVVGKGWTIAQLLV